MYVIKENVIDEFIINKSRFITHLYKVYTEDECKEIIKDLNNKYKDATHICYAYIINNTKRFNDDGEPGGTAGMPILNVIENNQLNYTLCAVIRYFGGIKLGAGGLVRAYTKGASGAVQKSNLCSLIDGYKIEINFNYDKVKTIDNFLKNCTIIDKIFNDTITYIILISVNEYKLLNLESIGLVSILENIEIENDV